MSMKLQVNNDWGQGARLPDLILHLFDNKGCYWFVNTL